MLSTPIATNTSAIPKLYSSSSLGVITVPPPEVRTRYHPPVAPSLPESPYAWLRLWVSLALMTFGGVGMYAMAVALPLVQAEFAVGRSEASLPYTLTMVGFGLGGIA